MIFFLQGWTYTDCEHTVLKAIQLFDALGFVIHPKKSSLIPSQQIVYLGFLINSGTMKLSLTIEKKTKLRNFLMEILNLKTYTIRTIACLVGKIVSSLPASRFRQLYYRNIARDKIQALSHHRLWGL